MSLNERDPALTRDTIGPTSITGRAAWPLGNTLGAYPTTIGNPESARDCNTGKGGPPSYPFPRERERVVGGAALNPRRRG
jgi:hypothetical protein